MKIVAATVKPCSQRLKDAKWKFARATVPQMNGWVLVLENEAGTQGLGYVHAIPAITGESGGARASLDFLTPLLVDRDSTDISGIMSDVEAALAFNYSVKAGIDMALHDLLARELGVPLHVLFGGKLRSAVAQSRIVPIKEPAAMAEYAGALAAAGYKAVKLKLAGDTALDVERIREVRAAIGDTVGITLDPNQSYTAKQMIAAFGKMERYDIALIEQPVPAADWDGLKLVTQTLPVAIEADETALTVNDVLRIVTDRVADVVNLKITKLGGLRQFMAAVKLCEAGNITCRMGAAFGPSLMQATSLHAAVTLRTLPFACELSEHQHLLDDPFTPLPVEQGMLTLPEGAGCGIQYADQTA